ncbi:hypothetical protein VM1G_06139 [Cytospora mali]|uniref:Uncharacterized protein n=1 Tax=Cytospora mali TaxID=578113 RepID=A0A194W0Z2_CYTMA|nr:hypothetical protein VM1G_06139 [Valsa mali]
MPLHEKSLKLRVWGADLFLLEKWDMSSSLPDDDQLLQIFSSFIQLPFAQRYAYTQRVRGQGFKKPTDLPQADQDLLDHLRKPEELQAVAGMVWLQTCYEEGGDAAFSAFLGARMDKTEFPVFRDARRYNYGGGDGWRRIFTRLPQMLDPSSVSPDRYEDEKKEALEECYEAEQQDTAEVGEQGGDPEEDGTYWMELYSGYHYAAKVGLIFVADEEMVRAAAVDLASAKVLAVWFDEMGRVVRHTRMSADETWNVEVLETVMCGVLPERGEWMRAEPGEDYDWDGPLGPPSITGQGDDSEEDSGKENSREVN